MALWPTACGSACRAATPHLFGYSIHTYELPRDLLPRSELAAMARAVDRRAQNAHVGKKRASHGDRPGASSTRSPSEKIAQNDRVNHREHKKSARQEGGHRARERLRARGARAFVLTHFAGVT